MSLFEALMLFCFGLSWPFSIAKALKTKRVTGKSPIFMIVIALGYVSGIIHKFLHSMDFVLVLYALNLLMVSLDLILYLRYVEKPGVTVS